MFLVPSRFNLLASAQRPQSYVNFADMAHPVGYWDTRLCSGVLVVVWQMLIIKVIVLLVRFCTLQSK